MTDMQGRLQGKRLTATHFLDEVAAHHAEGCNYLLAVDVEMNPVDGYQMASWERGYGDFVMRPDLDTLRPVPWQEGTALCLADLPGPTAPTSSPHHVRCSVRSSRASPTRLERQRQHRARVPRLQRQLRGGLAQGLPRPRAGQPLQRRLLAAGHRAGRAADPADPQRDDGRRARSRTPRASATSASTRSTSATPTRCARQTITRSTRTRPRRSPRRRACRSASWRSSTSARAARATSTSRSQMSRAAVRARSRRVRLVPSRTARVPARADAAARAERELLQALRGGFVRADRGRLGATTTAPARCGSSGTARRCGSRTAPAAPI